MAAYRRAPSASARAFVPKNDLNNPTFSGCLYLQQLPPTAESMQTIVVQNLLMKANAFVLPKASSELGSTCSSTCVQRHFQSKYFAKPYYFPLKTPIKKKKEIYHLPKIQHFCTILYIAYMLLLFTSCLHLTFTNIDDTPKEQVRKQSRK